MKEKTRSQDQSKVWIVVECLEGSGIIGTIRNEQIHIISKEDLKNDPALRFKKGDKIIISTETVLDDVLQHLDDPEKQGLISTLKNKVTCRQMLSPLFPGCFFDEISIPELATLELDPTQRYFVKPTKGYWGSAAYALNSDTDRLTVAAILPAYILLVGIGTFFAIRG